MQKKILMIFLSIFVCVLAQNVSAQSGFYSTTMLKSDFKQVNVVVHVEIKSRELVDHIGEGGCEDGKGTGYCLYRLKAEVKEIFKGKIETENFEFYTVVEPSLRIKTI